MLFAGCLLLASTAANAQDSAPDKARDLVAALEAGSPRVSYARVDWDAAVATLTGIGALPAHSEGAGERGLSHLNLAAGLIFRNVGASPVPVLLPFDIKAYLHDFTAGNVATDLARYRGNIELPTFFLAGPAGYDAALLVRPPSVPELSDIKLAEPLHVLISGSAMLYELAGAEHARGTPVPKLEAAFPGIRRLLHEGHLRYTFVRFGAPYILSLECYDGPRSRFRLPACRQADRVLIHLLNALRVIGGKPGASEPKPTQLVRIERPEQASSRFHYHPPGRLLPNSSVRKLGGNTDNTVYANIRFPLAEAPALVSSQVHWRRSPPIGKDDAGGYIWRDNFCERRSFRVGQCPAGFGHQGQDIRPPPCKRSNGETCKTRHEVVAVRNGAILRAPKQEAAYLVVNSATEHLRFRYLHMHPRRMDDDNLLSGRVVREGEVIGGVSNYSRKDAGTSYHLHFDLKVPTRDGWVFVNPYMTLVTAYERLIGARGQQIKEDPIAQAEASVAPARPAESPGRKSGSHSTLSIHTTVKVLADEVKPAKVVHNKTTVRNRKNVHNRKKKVTVTGR